MRSPVDVALADLARCLDALGIRWFLFGGQAAIIYGSTRVTEDIDVTIELGACTPRRLVSAVLRKGFALRAGTTPALVERDRVLPIVHTASSIPVDIVFAGPGLEESFLARRQEHQREGTRIPVASPEDLIVMKILAGRPRDVDDIRAVLRATKSTLDVAHIRETLALLEQALGQSDLLPLLAGLRREAARLPGVSPPARVAAPAAKRGVERRTPAKRKQPVRKTKR